MISTNGLRSKKADSKFITTMGLMFLTIIFLVFVTSANATAEAGWQAEPCSYSATNALCIDEKKSPLTANRVDEMDKLMILAALVEKVGNDNAIRCKALGKDVATTTEKPVSVYIYYRCLVMFAEM